MQPNYQFMRRLFDYIVVGVAQQFRALWRPRGRCGVIVGNPTILGVFFKWYGFVMLPITLSGQPDLRGVRIQTKLFYGSFKF
jgi:hypothetical protein